MSPLYGCRDGRAAGFVGGQTAYGEKPDVWANLRQSPGQLHARNLRQSPGQLHAAETGHIDIRNDERDFPGTSNKQDDSLHAIDAAHDAIAMFLKDSSGYAADAGIVVHKEDQFAVAVRYVKR